ncbi:hypothetical protein MKW98_000183 [Papaver atlanticum]|uniref:Uncharacterized protein n=1 Tax=Papaver atlanticum TaxID=357466 RepID=A0AAD4SS45_9MAGN|nr:hypothetical protein MKW98_000183 [Papaver atlanticum]
MDSVEKAHVLVTYKNKMAPEPMRTRLIGLLGEKLMEDPAKARGNPEQRRAVLTFQAIPPTWGSKLREECLGVKIVLVSAKLIEDLNSRLHY